MFQDAITSRMDFLQHRLPCRRGPEITAELRRYLPPRKTVPLSSVSISAQKAPFFFIRTTNIPVASVFAAGAGPPKSSKLSTSSPNFSNSPLNESNVDDTGSVTAILTVLSSVASLTLKFMDNPNELASANAVQGNVAHAADPLFFATISNVHVGGLKTPLTVAVAGLAKWLEIYTAALMVRVLLSWFPNIPWDRQPLSALRDMCDPYLSLFRNMIPLFFGAFDVSPLLAFAILGALGSILNINKEG